MTDNIYEYKDEKNWFVGKWQGFNTLAGLGQVSNEAYLRLNHDLASLHDSDKVDSRDNQNWRPNGYDVTVIKKSSDFRLIAFVVDMIAQETGRPLKVKQHQGAVLVTEKERLLLVHLPEAGVKLDDFFGNSGAEKLGDTILIATRNEGKTKEFRKMFEKLGIKVENLNDYPDLPEVAETGMTFEENARLKAETISEITGKMVLSDDSGLKVDVLGGLPEFGQPVFLDQMRLMLKITLNYCMNWPWFLNSKTAQPNSTQPWLWQRQVRKVWLLKQTGQVTLLQNPEVTMVSVTIPSFWWGKQVGQLRSYLPKKKMKSLIEVKPLRN